MFSSIGKAFTDIFSPSVRAQHQQETQKKNKKHSRDERSESVTDQRRSKKQKIASSSNTAESEMDNFDNKKHPLATDERSPLFPNNQHIQQLSNDNDGEEPREGLTDGLSRQRNNGQNEVSRSTSPPIQYNHILHTSWRDGSDLQLSIPSSSPPSTLTTTITTSLSPNINNTDGPTEDKNATNSMMKRPPKIVSPIPTRGRFLSVSATPSVSKEESTPNRNSKSTSPLSQSPIRTSLLTSSTTSSHPRPSSPVAFVSPIRPPFRRLSSPPPPSHSPTTQSTSLEDQILTSMYISPLSKQRAQSVLSEIERIEDELQEREYLDYLRKNDHTAREKSSTSLNLERGGHTQDFVQATHSFVVDNGAEFTLGTRRLQQQQQQQQQLDDAPLQKVLPLRQTPEKSQQHSVLFTANSPQMTTTRRISQRISPLDSYINAYLPANETIHRNVPKYKEVDLWQLELENKTFRERREQGLQLLNHLRKLAEKYRGSEVQVNFERLAKAQTEALQTQEREARKLEEKKTVPVANNVAVSDEENFRALSSHEEERIKKALKGAPDDVVAEIANIRLERKDLKRLEFTEWLNDEVVNFYMQLLNERSQQSSNNGKQPKCYLFNSFFYTLLSNGGYNYSRVQKWTRKIDIFTLDKVFVPVHLGNHWCLAVINFADKRFEYYDSLGGENPKCLERLRRYVKDEYRTKHKGEYDLSEWQDYTPLNIPHQQNGYDCGVFMCKFADYLSRGKPFDFSQSDMSYFRKRMILEILSKSAKENGSK
jgi:hypothetical protein